ncbi:hypothetical protein ACFU51_37285 [Streptomyces sp. NPDC057430]|uniref:hypothetical protein n=1 Tax=Streptomyces sp. NPDC057430 TaxID=3346131 RepID=UPI00367B0688
MLNGEGLGELADFASELLAAGVEVVFRSIEEIAIYIDSEGVRIRETVSGRDLADFGLVQVFAYHRPTATLLNALEDYLAVKGVRTVNVAGIGAPTKLFKYVRLANRGLSIPSTVYLPPRLLPGAYHDLAARLDLPFVMKPVTGGRASSVARERSPKNSKIPPTYGGSSLRNSSRLMVRIFCSCWEVTSRSLCSIGASMAAICWRKRAGRTPLSLTRRGWIRRHRRPLYGLRRHWGMTSPVSTSSGIGRLGNGVS